MPKTPIEHVVIILQENHSTTNYFGAHEGESPEELGPLMHDPTDLPPAWPTHGAFTMDNPDLLFVRQHYVAGQLPLYDDWIENFPLCDNYYAEYNSPSTPNHWSLIAADSGGLADNPHHGVIAWIKGQVGGPPFAMRTVPGILSDQGISWGNYGMGAFQDFKELVDSDNDHAATQFEKDARDGKLPAVSWLVAPHFDLNEHTPDKASDGMYWVGSQIQAIVDGGGWKNTAVFLVWDEAGGFHDRTKPPLKETMEHKNRGVRFWLPAERQMRWGPRCPAIVLNAFGKAGYRPGKEGAQDNSHVSLLKFVVDNFGVDTSQLSELQRDRLAQSSNMMDCFDFTQQPQAPPVTKFKEIVGRIVRAIRPGSDVHPTTRDVPAEALPTPLKPPAPGRPDAGIE